MILIKNEGKIISSLALNSLSKQSEWLKTNLSTAQIKDGIAKAMPKVWSSFGSFDSPLLSGTSVTVYTED